jgi:hypothetical protein
MGKIVIESYIYTYKKLERRIFRSLYSAFHKQERKKYAEMLHKTLNMKKGLNYYMFKISSSVPERL